MKSIKGNTLSQVMVQLAVMNFNDELSKKWTKFRTGKDNIPDLDQLVKFVEPLSHICRFSSRQFHPASNNSKGRTVRGSSPMATVSHLVDCPLCKNAYHPLHRYSVFIFPS